MTAMHPPRTRRCVCSRSISRPRKAFVRAFSLVEVMLALGVIAFAILPTFALIPKGLFTFRQSIETSVSAQIAQRIINELQQTDFDLVVQSNTVPFRKATRFFDDHGNQLDGADTSKAIYQVNIRITPGTSLPETSGTANMDLATGTIQVALNPSNAPLSFNGDTNLWNPSVGATVLTYATLIGRNN